MAADTHHAERQPTARVLEQQLEQHVHGRRVQRDQAPHARRLPLQTFRSHETRHLTWVSLKIPRNFSTKFQQILICIRLNNMHCYKLRLRENYQVCSQQLEQRHAGSPVSTALGAGQAPSAERLRSAQHASNDTSNTQQPQVLLAACGKRRMPNFCSRKTTSRDARAFI